MNRKEYEAFLQRMERIKKLDVLINSQKTGTLKDLAETLNVSESVLLSDFELMNEQGAEITYDIVKKTYYNKRPGKFFIGWLSTKDKKKLDADKERTKKANMPERFDVNRLITISKKNNNLSSD